MCNIRLQAPTLDRKCEISHWSPCGADEQMYQQSYGQCDNQMFLAMVQTSYEELARGLMPIRNEMIILK